MQSNKLAGERATFEEVMQIAAVVPITQGGDYSRVKGFAVTLLTSSPTFAPCVSGGGFPLLGDNCSRSSWFLLHRAA
jgi:hypothetical protein